MKFRTTFGGERTVNNIGLVRVKPKIGFIELRVFPPAGSSLALDDEIQEAMQVDVPVDGTELLRCLAAAPHLFHGIGIRDAMGLSNLREHISALRVPG